MNTHDKQIQVFIAVKQLPENVAATHTILGLIMSGFNIPEMDLLLDWRNELTSGIEQVEDAKQKTHLKNEIAATDFLLGLLD